MKTFQSSVIGPWFEMALNSVKVRSNSQLDTRKTTLFLVTVAVHRSWGLDLLVPQWKRTKHQRAPPAWALGDFGAETVYLNDANSISPISEVNQWKDSVRSFKHYKTTPSRFPWVIKMDGSKKEHRCRSSQCILWAKRATKTLKHYKL